MTGAGPEIDSGTGQLVLRGGLFRPEIAGLRTGFFRSLFGRGGVAAIRDLVRNADPHLKIRDDDFVRADLPENV